MVAKPSNDGPGGKKIFDTLSGAKPGKPGPEIKSNGKKDLKPSG